MVDHRRKLGLLGSAVDYVNTNPSIHKSIGTVLNNKLNGIDKMEIDNHNKGCM